MKNLAAVHQLSAALTGYYAHIFQGKTPKNQEVLIFLFLGLSWNFLYSIQALLTENGKKFQVCERATVLLSPNCLPLPSQIL